MPFQSLIFLAMLLIEHQGKKIMAAPITTVSTSLEGQWLEITTALRLKQRNTTSNPNGTNIISNLNLDHDTQTGTVSATFPFATNLSARGEPVSQITEIYDV